MIPGKSLRTIEEVLNIPFTTFDALDGRITLLQATPITILKAKNQRQIVYNYRVDNYIFGEHYPLAEDYGIGEEYDTEMFISCVEEMAYAEKKKA